MTLATSHDLMNQSRASNMNPDDAEPRLQSTAAQYPPPPTASEDPQHDFVQSAVAALQSARPHGFHLHQLQNASPSTPSQTVPRKRKPAIPGSRGVAHLTPDQLSKKRKNDRLAQRAIRLRTKNTIEVLEARITELESQQPYQEMQRALAERDAALSECEELRRRLEAVAGIVGNQNIGQIGLSQLAALTAQQSPLPPLSEQAVSQQLDKEDSELSGQYATSQHEPQPHLHPDLRPTSPEAH